MGSGCQRIARDSGMPLFSDILDDSNKLVEAGWPSRGKGSPALAAGRVVRPCEFGRGVVSRDGVTADAVVEHSQSFARHGPQRLAGLSGVAGRDGRWTARPRGRSVPARPAAAKHDPRGRLLAGGPLPGCCPPAGGGPKGLPPRRTGGCPPRSPATVNPDVTPVGTGPTRSRRRPVGAGGRAGGAWHPPADTPGERHGRAGDPPARPPGVRRAGRLVPIGPVRPSGERRRLRRTTHRRCGAGCPRPAGVARFGPVARDTAASGRVRRPRSRHRWPPGPEPTLLPSCPPTVGNLRSLSGGVESSRPTVCATARRWDSTARHHPTKARPDGSDAGRACRRSCRR